MTHARANLTALIREVRYGKRTAAFTERGERSAYVVPPDEYERRQRDREVLDLLRKRAEEAVGNEHEIVRDHARVVLDWLNDAAASVRL